MPLYPVENDYPDQFKIPPANRINQPGKLTLYHSHTGFEAALADTDAERLMDMYAEAIIDVWNPWQIANEHLPFLAWATGVNLWESWWDETFRRSWTARQWYLKSIRGKRAGLDEFVAAVGGSVKRCIVPPARAYGTKAMTDEERAAYVARFPQLRIYPYVAREQLEWLCYNGVHWNGTGQLRVWNKNGSFLGPRWRMYPTVQNAGGKYTRTAVYYEPRTGIETQLTIRRIVKILTGESAGWGYTPGVSQYDESVILPLEHRPAYFCGEPRRWLGRNIYLGKQLPLRTISIGRSGPMELTQAKAQYQTIYPQEELLKVRPEMIAIRHPRRKTELYACRGEYLIKAKSIVTHAVASNLEPPPPVFGRALFGMHVNPFSVPAPVIGAPILLEAAPLDAVTVAWIAAVQAAGGSVSNNRRALVNNFVIGMKADGIWPYFDRIWLLAAENQQSARVDLKVGLVATAVGTPTFTQDLGYNLTGASGYLETGYNFVTNATTFSQNSAHLACWNLTDGVNANPAVRSATGTTLQLMPKNSTDSFAFFRINDSSPTFAPSADVRGLLFGNRNGTARDAYQNDSSIFTYGVTTSVAVPNATLQIYSRRITAVSVGGALYPAEYLAFYNRLRTYMTAVVIPHTLVANSLLIPSPAFGASTLVVPLSSILLLHFEGADASTTFTDSSPLAHVVTPVASAQIDTGRFKFGAASLLVAGTDSLDLDGSADFAFGTGDFTIDFWELQTTTSGTRTFIDFRPAATQGMYPVIQTVSGVPTYYVNSAVRISGGIAPFNTWHHFALTRASGVTRMFLNGIQVGSDYADTNNYIVGASRPRICSGVVGSVDEVRVIKGTAVWTGNFTPPTGPYTV